MAWCRGWRFPFAIFKVGLDHLDRDPGGRSQGEGGTVQFCAGGGADAGGGGAGGVRLLKASHEAAAAGTPIDLHASVMTSLLGWCFRFWRGWWR